MKLLSILIMVLLAPNLFAIDKDESKKLEKRVYPPLEEFDTEAFNEGIRKDLKQFRKDLKKDKVTGLGLMIQLSIFTQWSEHPYIEDSTKIKRSWFKKIAIIVDPMSKLKNAMESCLSRGYTNQYEAYRPYYDKLKKRAVKLLEDPAKVKKKKGRR